MNAAKGKVPSRGGDWDLLRDIGEMTKVPGLIGQKRSQEGKRGLGVPRRGRRGGKVIGRGEK